MLITFESCYLNQQHLVKVVHCGNEIGRAYVGENSIRETKGILGLIKSKFWHILEKTTHRVVKVKVLTSIVDMQWWMITECFPLNEKTLQENISLQHFTCRSQT